MLWLPLTFVFAQLASGLTIRQNVCNGKAEYCSRKYADMVFIGAHDSAAIGGGDFQFQNKGVTDQLKDGIRLLQSQGHGIPDWVDSGNNPSNIHVCHENCAAYDGGPIEAYLGNVKSWLDDNPSEVITLVFANRNKLDVDKWDQGFRAAGISDLAYVPPKVPMGRDDWPTLGEFISSGKRVVIFLDDGADQKQYPYILDQFSQVYENDYSQTDLPLNCSPDRGDNPSNSLFLQNQAKARGWPLKVSDPGAAATVNSASGSNGVVETVKRCASQNGNRATFVLVDFYDVPGSGGVFDAAEQLNAQATSTSTSSSTNSTSGSGSGGGSSSTTSSSSSSSNNSSATKASSTSDPYAQSDNSSSSTTNAAAAANVGSGALVLLAAVASGVALLL